MDIAAGMCVKRSARVLVQWRTSNVKQDRNKKYREGVDPDVDQICVGGCNRNSSRETVDRSSEQSTMKQRNADERKKSRGLKNTEWMEKSGTKRREGSQTCFVDMTVKAQQTRVLAQALHDLFPTLLV